jgi:DNA-binding NarL/FixJ family response regulator
MSEKIRVLIADDHVIFRKGLSTLLQDEADIEVVGEAATGLEAVELAEKLMPSVVLMDITMPGMDGLHAASQIRKNHHKIRIIIISVSSDEEFVMQAIELGVNGYLVKQTAAGDVITAIREVCKGNAFLSPSVSKVFMESHNHPGGRDTLLTLRERDVLRVVVEGRTNREISAILCISVKTVEKYRQQIMDKLDIHDVAGLTRFAISKGFVK